MILSLINCFSDINIYKSFLFSKFISLSYIELTLINFVKIRYGNLLKVLNYDFEWFMTILYFKNIVKLYLKKLITKTGVKQV